MPDLTNRVAIITGASRGIGAATAKELARLGCHVIIAARSADKLTALAEEIETATGSSAIPVVSNMTHYADVENVVTKAMDAFGRIDILVNNAGMIDPISRIATSDPDAWSQVVDLNLKGVYYGMRSVLPVMEQQGNGTIINISSGAANGAMEGWSHYCSTKAAVQSLTRCGHKEYADKGITVIGLSPGTVATDMMQQIKQSGINPVSQLDWSVHIPPEWPARAIAYLCTGENAQEFAGTDFSIKTEEGRRLVGLAA